MLSRSAPVFAAPPVPGTYSTSFPATENPLSESGNWVQPATAVWNTSVRSVANTAAFGDPASAGTNDSIVCLTGNTYGKTQTVTGVVYRNGSFGSAEIELHVLMSFNTTQVFTYELDLTPSGVFVVKWLGTQNSISVLNGSGDAYDTPLADGDVWEFKAFYVSTTLHLEARQNGVLISSVTDASPYTTGNPGMGFDVGAGGTFNHLGWKSYSAVTTT